MMKLMYLLIMVMFLIGCNNLDVVDGNHQPVAPPHLYLVRYEVTTTGAAQSIVAYTLPNGTTAGGQFTTTSFEYVDTYKVGNVLGLSVVGSTLTNVQIYTLLVIKVDGVTVKRAEIRGYHTVGLSVQYTIQ